MKNIQKLMIIILFAGVAQVAKSDEAKQASALPVDEETILKACANLPASVRLSMLLANSNRFTCQTLIDSCGEEKKDVVEELRERFYHKDIMKTPYGKRKEDAFFHWLFHTREDIDNDECNAYDHVKYLRDQQAIYSDWLRSNRTDEKLAEELEKNLKDAEDRYFYCTVILKGCS